MSQNSFFHEEPSGADEGGMDFPGIGEAHFVFEDKNLVYSEEDQVQNELEIQLGEESHTDVGATVLWKHVVKGRKCGSAHGGSHVFKCRHCQKVYHGTYTRVYAHLMGHKKGESKGIGYCSVVKADKTLQQQIKREVEQVESSPNIVPLKKSKLSASSGTTSHGSSLPLSYGCSYDKEPLTLDKDNIDSKVIRCLCANGIPFNVLKSPYWEEMISAVSKELGYKSPSCEKAHAILLENERKRIEREFDDFKHKWPQYGISIASYGWSKAKNQPLVNFFASNLFGSMFLHALDFLMVKKGQKTVSECMLEVIKKIGSHNVVQLIMDNAASCKTVSQEVVKAYPYIFWTPCMVHTLKMILKDIIRAFPWLKSTYMTAKGIVKYIIYHSHAVDIIETYSKLEWLRVGIGGSASHYIIFHLLLHVREDLVAAGLCDRWKVWSSIRNLDEKVKLSGETVKEVVMSENFWEAVKLALLIIKPIYKMIKFTDEDGPIIGEVCERMDNMIGEIKDNLKEQEDIFMIVRQKVITWWSKTNFPLQCLAYALTPKYYDEEYLQMSAPGGIKRCSPDRDDDVFDCATAAICNMHQNDEQADTIRVQFMSFIEKNGKFASPTAKRDARNPKINVLQWWKFHGGDTKELRDMAFKVLAQPISSSSVERPWSTYNFIDNAKQNILNRDHADDLLFVHSNLRLLSRSNPNYKYGPHRKWDVNPEHSLMDESTSHWEDMHFLGLDDESTFAKQGSCSHNPINELLRIVEDVPTNNNQCNEQSQVSSTHSCGARGGRGGRGGATGRLDLKGKTKKFL